MHIEIIPQDHKTVEQTTNKFATAHPEFVNPLTIALTRRYLKAEYHAATRNRTLVLFTKEKGKKAKVVASYLMTKQHSNSYEIPISKEFLNSKAV